MQMQWVSKASLVFQGVTLRNSGRLVGRCRTSRAVHLSAEDLYSEAEVVLLPIPDRARHAGKKQLCIGIRESATPKKSFLISRNGLKYLSLIYVHQHVQLPKFELRTKLRI
ncbi:unnamed protein product [Lasius platythorax]|uniref:Uncharacterized protein n=1 Tax=Lasius platythorax TaxID=488582 RepID=A0AAV2NZG9_9HYME